MSELGARGIRALRGRVSARPQTIFNQTDEALRAVAVPGYFRPPDPLDLG